MKRKGFSPRGRLFESVEKSLTRERILYSDQVLISILPLGLLSMKNEDLKDRKKAVKKMKKEFKKQRKSQKKERKKHIALAKEERKLAREEIKLQRRGYRPQQPPMASAGVVEVEVEGEAAESSEDAPSSWAMKSPAVMPIIEKRIDVLTERKGPGFSSIDRLYRERYGEDLEVPYSYKIPELSAEDRRLIEEERVHAEAEAVKAKKAARAARGKFRFGRRGRKAPSSMKTGDLKPIYHPINLYIYKRFGQDRNIILKGLIFLISLALALVFFLPRVVVFLLVIIISKIRGRRKKAPSKT